MQPQTERRRRITLLFGDEPANLIAVEKILDAMSASVWATRPDGQLSYANRRFWEYSGLPTTEKSLGACLSVIHPDEEGTARTRFDDGLRGAEAWEMRCRLRRAEDGAYRWHVCRTLPVEGATGALTGWITVATDIHDLVGLTEVGAAPPDVNVRRVRTLLRDGPMPIAMFEGPEHRCVFLNASAEVLLARDVVGRTFREAFPQASDRLLAVFDKVYESGQSFAAREFPAALDGEEPAPRFFDLVFQPTRDATGTVFGILVGAAEVTNQIEARREIERHADRLARLQEIASALSDVLDPVEAGEIVSEQACLALGADSAGVMLLDRSGRTLESVASTGMDPGGRERFQRMSAEANLPAAEVVRTGDPVVLETREQIEGRYPELRDWLTETRREALVALPLHGQGGTVGALWVGFTRPRTFDSPEWDFVETLARQCGAAIDRARLYRAAQSARVEADLQRERLRQVVMEAPVPMLVCRGGAHVIELENPAWRAFLPRSSDSTGRAAREAYPELEAQGFLRILAEALRTGQTVSVKEASLHVDRAADGNLDDVFVNLTAQPYRDVDGDLAGIIVVANDVTQEVRARRRLEHEVAARAASERERAALLEEEKITRHRAETANRAKDEFLAMLGHELRNPLAPIVTALQLLKLRGEMKSGRELVIIERQVRHLVRLVDDLLDVSRITRGTVQLKREPVELATIVAKAVEIASPLFEQRGHHLRIDVAPIGLALDADITRLAQVVANLLTNAAKYTDPGGHIALTAAREGAEIVLRVKDDGMGIPADLLPVVFDLFVQGERALDRSEGGLGIGLTLVRSLLALHGGTVEARSDGPGRGSEFIVRLRGLPQAVPLPRPREASGSGLVGRAGRARVLIVDDNVDAAELLAELVRAAGYEVAIAHDGPSALVAAARFEPEVAVLDIGLPVMDGYELARRLRNRPGGEDVRLVAVTGYGQQQDRENSAAAGFERHFMKPVDASALLAAIAPTGTHPRA